MIVRIVVIGTGVRCLISAGILLGLSVRLCFHSLTSHTFPNFDSMDPSSSPLLINTTAASLPLFSCLSLGYLEEWKKQLRGYKKNSFGQSLMGFRGKEG